MFWSNERHKRQFEGAVRLEAKRLGIPEDRREELIALARDQIIAETGSHTMYDVLRRAADLAKNS